MSTSRQIVPTYGCNQRTSDASNQFEEMSLNTQIFILGIKREAVIPLPDFNKLRCFFINIQLFKPTVKKV